MPTGLWVMDFLANVEKLGRILMAPPGIPPARLAYLQAAVKETLHNPQLIAEGEKAERIIEYLDPAGTHQNAVAVVGGVTPEQKARVLKLLSGEEIRGRAPERRQVRAIFENQASKPSHNSPMVERTE